MPTSEADSGFDDLTMETPIFPRCLEIRLEGLQLTEVEIDVNTEVPDRLDWGSKYPDDPLAQYNKDFPKGHVMIPTNCTKLGLRGLYALQHSLFHQFSSLVPSINGLKEIAILNRGTKIEDFESELRLAKLLEEHGKTIDQNFRLGIYKRGAPHFPNICKRGAPYFPKRSEREKTIWIWYSSDRGDCVYYGMKDKVKEEEQAFIVPGHREWSLHNSTQPSPLVIFRNHNTQLIEVVDVSVDYKILLQMENLATRYRFRPSSRRLCLSFDFFEARLNIVSNLVHEAARYWAAFLVALPNLQFVEFTICKDRYNSITMQLMDEFQQKFCDSWEYNLREFGEDEDYAVDLNRDAPQFSLVYPHFQDLSLLNHLSKRWQPKFNKTQRNFNNHRTNQHSTLKQAEAKWASSKTTVAGMELVERYYQLKYVSSTTRDIIDHVARDCLLHPEGFSNNEFLMRLALLKVFSNSNQIDATLERMATEKITAIPACDPSWQRRFDAMLGRDVPSLCRGTRRLHERKVRLDGENKENSPGAHGAYRTSMSFKSPLLVDFHSLQLRKAISP